MSEKNIEVGPILKRDKPIIYALDSDESSMVVSEEELSERQREEDTRYVRENSSFGLAALCISDTEDALVVDDNFESQKDLIEWLSAMYQKLGLMVSPNIFFAKPKTFYPKAIELIRKHGYDRVSSTSVSHILSHYFKVDSLLRASIKLNKKTTLFDLAQKYHFDTPKALFVSDFADSLRDIREAFSVSEYPLFIKSDGLGGGSNISKIKAKDELENFATVELGSGGALIQASAPHGSLETISTFSVYPDRVAYINTRGKMVDGGQWYGNVFHPHLKLADSQKNGLQNAAIAAQSEGYISESGLLIGFDAFLHGDEALITEINARWLGSTQYEQLLKKLNLLGQTIAVSSFDYIHIDELESYKTLVEHYLFGSRRQTEGFSIIPISFSAYEEKNGTRLVSYLILGDFRKFVKVARGTLSHNSFIMLETSMGVYDKVLNYVDSH